MEWFLDVLKVFLNLYLGRDLTYLAYTGYIMYILESDTYAKQ